MLGINAHVYKRFIEKAEAGLSGTLRDLQLGIFVAGTAQLGLGMLKFRLCLDVELLRGGLDYLLIS